MMSHSEIPTTPQGPRHHHHHPLKGDGGGGVTWLESEGSLRGRKIHDFKASLDWENQEASAPWWATIYRSLFADAVSMEIAPRGSALQRQGVDRILTLRDGSGITSRITLQEKVRDRDYRDFLIEYQHAGVDGHSWQGWIQRTRADYLVYVARATGTVRMWRTDALRRAWTVYGPSWRKTFGTVRAENRGYVTLSCPVPLAVLPEHRAIHIPALLLGKNKHAKEGPLCRS